MNLHDKFLDKENFYLAFKRLRAFYSQNIEWYDPIELSSFEANLSTNIHYLIERVKDNDFEPRTICALPFPKRNKSTGEERIRPFYKIDIEDQIIWLAIVNVIGYLFEPKIPNWSYGNRLYQPVWYSLDEEGNSIINKGSTKNTSAHIYRKWNQSWPFFRRHISITIKSMASGSKMTPEDIDNDIERQIYMDEVNKDDYPYLNGNYWKTRSSEKLYWLNLDFQKFFPSINTKTLFQEIRHILIEIENRTDVNHILNIIERLLNVDVVFNGWKLSSIDELGSNFVKENTSKCLGLPTGLLVAGFLANVAMLKLDKKLDEWIKNTRKLALFKFVDDHVIISDSNDTIRDFLEFYHKELTLLNTGAQFNNDKIEPKLFHYNSDSGFEKTEIYTEKSNELDVKYPEPFFTDVLRKMSNLNDEEFSLMNDEELQQNEEDLRYFLLAKFEDSGLRRDTRISFSAMRLCKLAKFLEPNYRNFDPHLNSNKLILDEDVKKNLNKIKAKSQKKKILLESFNTQNIKNRDQEISLLYKKYDQLFDLILRSTIEFPDKLKLWKRSIDFCFITGINKINEIFEVIDQVAVHQESKYYLRAYCNLLFSEYLIKGVAKLNYENISFWDEYRLQKFKSSVIDYSPVRNISSEHLFYQNSAEVLFVSQKICENEELSVIQFGSKIYQVESYIYFFLKRVYKNKFFWEKHIRHININSKESWSIFSFFPNDLPLEVFDKIIKQNRSFIEMSTGDRLQNTDNLIFEKFDFLNQNEGYLLDIFEHNKEIKDNYKHLFPQIKKVIEKKYRSYLTLDRWLKQLVKSNEKSKWIDPRLSEWSIIEIVKQIAQLKQQRFKEIGNKFIFEDGLHKFFFVHPKNYLIPKSWLNIENPTWQSWESLVKEDLIKLTEKEYLIDDYRYLPFKNYWKVSGALSYFFGNGFTTIIIGLCTMIVKLLGKTFEWPRSSNKLDFLDAFYSSILSTIENQPISTQTKHFLFSIFSRKNDDFLFTQTSFSYGDQKIENLDDFIKSLERLQANLSKYQISLIGNEPRQLIYIDIDLENKIQFD